jgi:hypothetical protein
MIEHVPADTARSEEISRDADKLEVVAACDGLEMTG